MEQTNRVRGGKARPLPAIGTELRAFHKGKPRSATIVEAADLSSGRGVRTGRRVYASLSAAGTAITGYAVNGWLFWRPVDDAGSRLADAKNAWRQRTQPRATSGALPAPL